MAQLTVCESFVVWIPRARALLGLGAASLASGASPPARLHISYCWWMRRGGRQVPTVWQPPPLQPHTTSNLTVSMPGTQEGLANGALIPKEFSCDFCLLYCRFHIHISQRGGARLRRTYRNLTYLKRGLPVRPRFSWNSQDFKVVVERSRAQNLCREFIFNTLKRLDIFFKINLRPIIILCRTSSSALDSKFENSGCLFKKKQKNNTFFVQFTLDLNQWKSEIQWKSHWISVNVALLKKFSDAMLT